MLHTLKVVKLAEFDKNGLAQIAAATAGLEPQKEEEEFELNALEVLGEVDGELEQLEPDKQEHDNLE